MNTTLFWDRNYETLTLDWIFGIGSLILHGYAISPHCNGYAKKCPQKPKFDGHRFDFLSIIPKVYYSFEHIMLKSSIVFIENVQKFDLHDSNFEPNWMKSTKLLYSL